MNSKTLFALLAAIVISSPLAAQEGTLRTRAELGYWTDKERDDTLFNPNGDLIDPASRTASAALSFNGQYSDGAWRVVGDAWAMVNKDHATKDSEMLWEFPEAYVEYSASEEVTIAAGATIARWGTGYVWNPANPLTDPYANNTSRARTYVRDGDPFVRIETLFGRDSAGIYFTHFRQNDPLLDMQRERENAVVLRYQHVLDSGDVTGFASFNSDEQFFGLATSHTHGDKLEIHGEAGLRSQRRAPQIRSTPLGGGQTLHEWDSSPRDAWTPAALLGGQYTFENMTNVIVEYLYNGNGFSNSEYDELRAAASDSQALLGTQFDGAARGFLQEANNLVGRMRRHYLFVRLARDEIARATDLHAYTRLGLEDRSVLNGVMLRHTINQKTRIQVSAENYAGSHDSETRLIPLKYRAEATLVIDF